VIRRIKRRHYLPLCLLNKTTISLVLGLSLSKKRHVLDVVFGAISLNGLNAINFATERNIVVEDVCARVTMNFSVPIIMMIEDVWAFPKMKPNPVIFLEMITLFVANGPTRIFGPFAFPTIIAVGMEPNGENKVVSVAVLFLVIPPLVYQQLVKPPVELKPDRAPMVRRVVGFNIPSILAQILLLTNFQCVLQHLGDRALVSVPIQPPAKSVPLILIILLLFIVILLAVLLRMKDIRRTLYSVLN